MVCQLAVDEKHPLQEDGEELISYLRFFNIRNVCSGLLEEYHTRDDNGLKLKYTKTVCVNRFFLFFVGPLFFFLFLIFYIKYFLLQVLSDPRFTNGSTHFHDSLLVVVSFGLILLHARSLNAWHHSTTQRRYVIHIARATIHSSLRRILKIFQDNSPVQDCERKRLVHLADQQTPFLHELSNYFA